MAEGVINMKKNIHPEYVDTKVTCICGNEFTVKSTVKELHVEVCDKCHPFYTGVQGATKKTGSFWELLGVAGNYWELQVSPSDSQNPPSALPESSQIFISSPRGS